VQAEVHVIVRFFASFRDITGASELDVTEHQAHVTQLVSLLAAGYGPTLADALMAIDELSRDVVLLVNGHNVKPLGGLATRLNADDAVAFFPMVSGG
jgi:MoaD family protein